MSERKAVSKYYPPTFDPSQLLPPHQSREITLRTVPQASDYVCDDMANETADERLDRLEREHEKRENTEKTSMENIEKEALATETRMAVADALDDVRARNARLERLRQDGITVDKNAAMTMEDQKDEEHTRRAFSLHARAEADVSDQRESHTARHTDLNALVKTKRHPKQTKLLPGLKQAQAKAPPATTSLVDYVSDSE
ncbi:Pre-mRNA-splicing factor cwf16 [Colletotrichum sp. SAR 10_86]|nr:Pre-mRNA-splicing factor cwf16 [Colletotrichum sp. SAR 10_86]